MSQHDLRSHYVKHVLSLADDVLEAEEPSEEFLDELFGAMVTVEDVKIIIVGQDAYPDRKKRSPMAFSYPRGVESTDSNLSIIIAANKGLDHHTTIDITPKDGYLGSWRDKGVLLINSRNNAEFISYVARKSGAIGILLGREAKESCSEFFKTVYSWAHPSARSLINNDESHPEHWYHTDVFWRANCDLVNSGRGFINWATVYESRRVYLFCDGGYSAKFSKGKAGVVLYSSIGSYLAEKVVSQKYHGHGEVIKITTNNIAELSALRMCFDIIADTGKNVSWSYIIYSDSQYSIKTVTEWYNNWVTEGKLVGKKNIPLVKNIVAEYEALPQKIIVRHTRGHQAKPGNDASALEELVYRGNTHVDELVSCA
jgi:uracil DNA glycosylase/ribonuclease HI